MVNGLNVYTYSGFTYTIPPSVVPSLLIPLTSPYQPIRHHAITCLSLLHHTHSLLPSPQRDSAYSTTPMFYLLDTLVESELALSSDPSALPHILGQMFHVEGKKGTAKRTHGLDVYITYYTQRDLTSC